MNKSVHFFLLIIVLFIGKLLIGQFISLLESNKSIPIIKKAGKVVSAHNISSGKIYSDSNVSLDITSAVFTKAKVNQDLSCANEYYLKTFASDTLSVNTRDAVATPGNGQIIVGGLFNANNADDINDPLIIKLDSNGNKVWEKNYNVTGNQFIHKVTALADGNFLGVGIDNVVNDASCFLIKFDSNGNILWRRSHLFTGIGPVSLVINKTKEDNDGNFIITGSFYLGGSPLLLFIKCNSSGSILLSKALRPPNMSIILGVSDMLVKDGFTYLSGKNYNWNFMNGLLVKINNANGTIVWGKQYDFNNSACSFSQILFYNNQICLLGLNGNNQSDTNIVMLCDTSGSINSSKYLSYPGFREPGTVMVKNDGNMVWLQNTGNDFSISAFHLQTGIAWTRKYNSLNNFPRIIYAFEGDKKSINFIGNNVGSNNYSNMFSGKFSENGALPCMPITIPSIFGNGTSMSQDILFTANNIVFQENTRNWFLLNEKVNTMDTICKTVITCDSLDIIAPGSICTGDTLKVMVRKNCSALTSLVYDSSQLQLLTMTDTLLKYLPLKPGPAMILISINNDCTITRDSVEVMVNKAANTLSLGNDFSICNGNNIALKARAGYANYQWQDGSADSTHWVTKAGIYYVTVSDFCGKTFRDSIIITSGSGTPIFIGPDRVKCNNDTLRLKAPDGYLNYSWFPNYHISSLVSPSVVINPSVDTMYYLKAEESPGCFVFDTILIKVNHSPAIQLGADTSICTGQALSLDAGNGFINYAWSNGNKGRTIAVNKKASFFVTATTTTGCNSSDTINLLNVYALPVVKLESNNELCQGSIRMLDAGAYSSFLWQNGSVSRTFSASTTGTYYVTVTDTKGCKGGDTTIIDQLLPLPHQFLPADTSVCLYSPLTLQASGNFLSYAWNHGTNSPTTIISMPGIYWLEVKDKKNCIGKDSIIVFSKQCIPGLFVPSAFTPNMDGINDVMRATLIGDVKNFEFKIFNRYGKMVFLTNNSREGWDGNIRGIKQEAGGFVWVCTYQLGNEPVKTEKGNILLIK